MPAYSGKAQPYLDAIASGIFDSEAIRNWLIWGTPAEESYRGAAALTSEQQAKRWHLKPTI